MILRRIDNIPVIPTDEQLIIRIGDGDRAAYKILVDRHLRNFLAFAARVTGDGAEAEDVMQEAFVRVWKNADKWDQGRQTRFTTWFYRIVMNLCIDVNRKRRPTVRLEEAFDVPSGGPLPDAQLDEKQMAAIIGTHMHQLPERQKIAMTLCYLQGQGNKEAAAILDISVSALESLLVRGRTTLAGYLKGHRDEFLKERV